MIGADFKHRFVDCCRRLFVSQIESGCSHSQQLLIFWQDFDIFCRTELVIIGVRLAACILADAGEWLAQKDQVWCCTRF